MDTLQRQAKDIKLGERVRRCGSYEEVCRAVETPGKPRLLMLSTPHGELADKCLESLRPALRVGDVVVDCGNEHWRSTERRQRDLARDGIHLVGCGVSGGYQSARRGPSMAPSGSDAALALVMPFLRTIAAKDALGRPCTEPVGPAGSGHFVKMVHNGIEQGMMSVVAETWLMLAYGLDLSSDEVADVFQSWADEGQLRGCFLIAIGADVERARRGDGEPVLRAEVRDTVVQDVDGEEGTGTWTCEEAVALHVPAASLASAHLFRCASADLRRRIANKKSAAGGVKARPLMLDDGRDFIEQLRRTVYFCSLACFAQGLDLIRERDRREGWGLDYRKILQLWRGGCIIQADQIVDLLDEMYSRAGHDADSVLANAEVGRELTANYDAIKQVVLRAVAADTFVPAISQSLEFFKYETSVDLPTQFMEAQLDYFGQHMFDKKDDSIRGPEKGRHHFEWKPARGLKGQ